MSRTNSLHYTVADAPNGDQLVEHLRVRIAEHLKKAETLSPEECTAVDEVCSRAVVAITDYLIERLPQFEGTDLGEAIHSRRTDPIGAMLSEVFHDLRWASHELALEVARRRRAMGSIGVEVAAWLELMEWEPEPPEWLAEELHQVSLDWRSLLPALRGLPLIPGGAGESGKAPINPDTGYPARDWQKASHTPEQIDAMNGVVSCVGTRCGPDAAGLLVLDLDGASAIDRCRAAGCDPEGGATWQIHRTTDTERLKVAWRIPQERWSLLPTTRKVITTKKATPGGKAEQIELFWATGQVIVLGEHRESGGQYFWPDGHGPQQLSDIPEAWWQFVLQLSAEASSVPSSQPVPPAPLDHPGLANATAGTIPLEQLLSLELAAAWEQGGSEGNRNNDLFRLAVGLTTAVDGARAEGLPTTGDPEQLAMEWAQRCSPPLLEAEARQTIRSALSQPRNPDPGLVDRIAYQKRRISQGREPAAVQLKQAANGKQTCKPAAPANAQAAPLSRLLEAALASAKTGDRDAYAETVAEIMGRFRFTPSRIQGELFRMLMEREAQVAGAVGDGRNYVDITQTQSLDHLLPGFIAANEQTLLYGDRGVGKTLASLELARAVVTGGCLLDRSDHGKPGSVLYIATDSGCDALRAQMDELGLLELPEFQDGRPQQRFFVRGHAPELGATAWEATIPEILWLLDEVRTGRFDLVIIDSAKAALSLTEVEYTDNKAVGALLTLVQRVICPHTAVIWLSHTGTADGWNAGAKAWAEIPAMVHRLEKVKPQKSGRNDRDMGIEPPPPGSRKWACIKSRLHGDEREFTFQLRNGELMITADVETVGSCRDAVLAVLGQAHQRGVEALQRSELVGEVMRAHGRSAKTVDNTLTQMRRAREVVSRGRGRYALSPAMIQKVSLEASPLIGKEEG